MQQRLKTSVACEALVETCESFMGVPAHANCAHMLVSWPGGGLSLLQHALCLSGVQQFISLFLGTCCQLSIADIICI